MIYQRDKNSTINELFKQIDKQGAPHAYFKSTGFKPKIIQHKYHRWKFQYRTFNHNTIDDRQTYKALPANVIQASDAELAKELILKFCCIPIHDSFIFELREVNAVMDATDTFFQKRVLNKGGYGYWTIV